MVSAATNTQRSGSMSGDHMKSKQQSQEIKSNLQFDVCQASLLT
jgi:hypothetical protein